MSKNKFKLGKHYSAELEGMPVNEVKDNLEGVCYGKEEGSYTKNLTEAELGVAKSKLADVSIEIAKIGELKKEYAGEIKSLLAEPTASHKELIDAIKHKSVRKEGILFLIDDQKEGMMYSFDENAICVDLRPLLPNEKQTRMRTINKAN